MTGAEALLRSAAAHGVTACFANPGTTEMDLVAALDSAPRIRTVLGLFEGVCTGMADGYGRMTGVPALTLLHLGVGLSNGMANLHNARRARTPVVNLVGDHPDAHLPYDAPLTSDIDTMARPVSKWVGRVSNADSADKMAARAIRHALADTPGVATLVLPADAMRGITVAGPEAPRIRSPKPVDEDAIRHAVDALRAEGPNALLLSGKATWERGLVAAHRIAAVTGCKVLMDCFPGRLDRGAGLPPVERLPYFPELVLERLQGIRRLVLAGAPAPVSFFLYPQWPSSLVPATCEVLPFVADDDDPIAMLEALADALGAPAGAGARTEASTPVAPEGKLDTRSIGQAIGAALPEGAIIADESATSGGPTYFLTMGCRPHSMMYLTGGGIGFGMPAATGAAVACPDRPVIALQGDGGGMYTPQALWTQAREGLNVTTIIFSNRNYQILRVELQRAGIVKPGPVAMALTDLTNPSLDWCALSKGMGVPASRPGTAEEFYRALRVALEEPGPHLIEAVI